MPRQSEPKGERTTSIVPRNAVVATAFSSEICSHACAVLCDGWAMLRYLLASNDI